eukprot:1155124-Pelagomonas_calceolata.AAC.3
MKIWTPEFRSYLLVRVLNRRGSRVPRDVIDLSSDPVNWCPFGAKATWGACAAHGQVALPQAGLGEFLVRSGVRARGKVQGLAGGGRRV